MKIYTKKGDLGSTSLIGGTRKLKSDIRIEAYGEIDELNSFVGMLRDVANNPETTAQLLEIQDRLFTMGSLLAADPEKSKMKLPLLNPVDITHLEEWIDQMESVLEPMTSFILPGGHPAVSWAHICRSITRRGERGVVALGTTTTLDPLIIQYLNRLSDYFFVLSRFIGLNTQAQQTKWVPKM